MCKFDLSNLPSADKITKATFSVLFLIGDPLNPTDDDVCSLYTIAKDWKEMEVTWNNADSNSRWDQTDLDTKRYDPGTGDTILYPGGGDRVFDYTAITKCAAAEKWEHYDVTTVIKEMVSNQKPNYGLLMKPSLCGKKTKNRNQGRSYASSDDNTIEDRPKLIVIYNNGSSIQYNKTSHLNCELKIHKTASFLKIYVPLNTCYSLTFCDIKGRQVHTFTSSRKQYCKIPIHATSSGVYLIHIHTSDKRDVVKYLLLP